MDKPSKSKAETKQNSGNRMNEPTDAETLRALQFALICAPAFDAQAEHEKDLEYESRVDYASWETEQESE